MRLAILITNPNHHLELTLGAAKIAKESGDEVLYVSLCELRRMQSPVETFEKEGFNFAKFADLPKQLKPSSGKKSLGDSNSLKRRLIRSAFWIIKLKPFVEKAFKGVDKVLLLNDAAFPGDKIANWLTKKNIPFYLLQEGIRFPLPNESEVKYGGNGAEKVLSWGKRSASHFEKVASGTTKVVVTGSPRFDAFLKEFSDTSERKERKKKLGIFTNPIDDQGFCSTSEKMELFENFVKRASKYFNSNNIHVEIKSHPREDAIEYLTIAQKHLDEVKLSPKHIVEAISNVDAGVIMASTVGLELLAAKKRFAQIEIPDFGYVFDYTDDLNVVKIPTEGAFELESLFEDSIDLVYFHEHIEEGESSEKIYKQIKS